MFASARTAGASPLASPSLKRVFEVANAHGPVMGLGIRVSGSPSMSSSSTLFSASTSSSTMHTSSDSSFGHPDMRRPALPRMQSSGIIIPPRTPRLQCAPILPSALSPSLPSPSSAQLPNAGGSFSEIREAYVSASRPMNIHLTQHCHFAATTSITRSTVRNNLFHTHPEVERIGLGISGLSLNSFTPKSIMPEVNNSNDVSAPALNDSEPKGERVPSKRICRRRRTTAMKPYIITKSVRFHALTQIIGSPNSNHELDGYAADNEGYDDQIPRRRRRRRDRSALSGFRSCRVRVLTPYFARDSESSWL